MSVRFQIVCQTEIRRFQFMSQTKMCCKRFVFTQGMKQFFLSQGFIRDFFLSFENCLIALIFFLRYIWVSNFETNVLRVSALLQIASKPFTRARPKNVSDRPAMAICSAPTCEFFKVNERNFLQFISSFYRFPCFLSGNLHFVVCVVSLRLYTGANLGISRGGGCGF